eukprot:14477267-Ditylum_brightwellii.AAC.1
MPYPYQVKKPVMESSMFYILQQQMKQREGDKATREQKLLIVHMERGAKPPAPASASTLFPS